MPKTDEQLETDIVVAALRLSRELDLSARPVPVHLVESLELYRQAKRQLELRKASERRE